MASGFQVSETIECPPDRVWAYLSDLKNADTWMKGVSDFEPVTPGPLKLGAKLSFTARGKSQDSEVTAWEPPRALALTSRAGGFRATYTYSLAPRGTHTQATLKVTCSARGAWKLLRPFIAFAMRHADSGQIRDLKRAIEGSS